MIHSKIQKMHFRRKKVDKKFHRVEKKMFITRAPGHPQTWFRWGNELFWPNKIFQSLKMAREGLQSPKMALDKKKISHRRKLFADVFVPRKCCFSKFRMNHYFLGVAFDAPFDLSWGSRRLISFTHQKRCFMTISRFQFFLAFSSGGVGFSGVRSAFWRVFKL